MILSTEVQDAITKLHQGVSDEDIPLATQRTAADERGRARDFSKRLSEVSRVAGNPVDSEFDIQTLNKVWTRIY